MQERTEYLSEETKKRKEDTREGEWMIGKAQEATCTSHRDQKFQQLHKIAVGKKRKKKKVCQKERNLQSQLYSPSFTHSVFHLLLTLPLLSVSAIHLHTHSSHASAFLLLSSSIPPFLHLLLCLLRPFLSPYMQHLSGREQDPAWVVSR